ncbi:uncharacterized protein [Pyrus communis]|uniref:uncharacterized protein n=1 Tax=Pyrus communis TaxID=23211 RepID=UPI0035BFF9AC
MLTIKLRDDNFAKWAFQFQSVLRGYKLFGHFDGTTLCPLKFVVDSDNGVTREVTVAYTEWETIDMALLSLLLATLTDEAMEYVIGCRTAYEAWINLVDQYATVSKSRINNLKTELHIIQKGSDTIDRYLLRLKHIREQLSAAGESISDNDVMIAGLAGLPKEYGVIRTIILDRESTLTLKEFRALLLGTEREIEGEMNTITQNLSALYIQGSSSSSNTGSSSNIGSSSFASSSNSHSYAHIPAITAGTITVVPYDSQSSLPPPPQVQQSYYSPQLQLQFQKPYYFPPPPLFSNDSYGYGFSAHSSGQHASKSQSSNAQSGSFGNHYRGNNNYRGGNNYRNNTGFRGRGHNLRNSRGSRQLGNGNNNWSGIVDTRTTVVIECQICNKRGHTAVNCFHRNTNIPITGSKKITIRNGTSLPIKNIGSTTLQTLTHSLVLNKVLHVPNIARSLLSVKQLCADNKSWFICDDSEFFVHDKKTKEIVYQGKSKMSRIPFPVRTDRWTSHFQKVHTDIWGPSPCPIYREIQIMQALKALYLSQVVFPFTSPPNNNNSVITDVDQNCIQTRLKTGTITRKSYVGCLASLPQLHSLHLDDFSAADFSTNLSAHVSGGFSFLADITNCEEPRTFKAASLKPEWQIAMQEEFNALKTQGTWILVPPPSNWSVIGSKWVYKVKKNPDGSISRFKARLVAHGYTQEQGLDYSETFSPVVRHTTVRLILALATQFNWQLRQLDIKNAFLHGDLVEDVYMKQPQGFVDATCPGHVCKLVKSLYGLKQAPRAWNSKFISYLPAIRFQSSLLDSSLFVKVNGGDIILLLLCVDDIILTGSNSVKIQYVIDDLAGVFDLKDMGRLTYFLGLHIQYGDYGSLFISQAKYAKDVLQKAGMDTCKSTSTPSKPHTQIIIGEGTLLSDPSHYRSIVGALQYLTFARPDIAYSVNMVCQFMAQPTDLHMFLVKRILRYIQGTISYGLQYTKSKEFNITAYSDSNWAANINTRRSITGFVVYLGNNPVSWQSKKQSTVSRSSTKAEYKALAHCAADVFWIRSVFKDIHQSISVPPSLYCDNLSALALSTNPVFHSKIKHLDTDYHFVREKVQKGDLMVHYIPTDDQMEEGEPIDEGLKFALIP